ncbi:MAG: hypothetical protein ACJA0U_000147 [Salibacteraceae bacterium]|jgi:hypothetical protein
MKYLSLLLLIFSGTIAIGQSTTKKAFAAMDKSDMNAAKIHIDNTILEGLISARTYFCRSFIYKELYNPESNNFNST